MLYTLCIIVSIIWCSGVVIWLNLYEIPYIDTGFHILNALSCIVLSFSDMLSYIFMNKWYQCCCNICHEKMRNYLLSKMYLNVRNESLQCKLMK